MNNETEKKTDEEKLPSQITTGAGIALAFIWLTMTALCAFIICLFFVFPDPPSPDEKWSAGETLFVFVVIIAPLLVATSMTRKIVGR